MEQKEKKKSSSIFDKIKEKLSFKDDEGAFPVKNQTSDDLSCLLKIKMNIFLTIVNLEKHWENLPRFESLSSVYRIFYPREKVFFLTHKQIFDQRKKNL